MSRFYCRNGNRGNGHNGRTIRQIIFASTHELLREQRQAIVSLHGNLEICHEPHLIGEGIEAAVKAVISRPDAFIYLVCSKAQHTCLDLACAKDHHLSYGFFSNIRHRSDRRKFDFVFHVSHGDLQLVWEHGETAIQVA